MTFKLRQFLDRPYSPHTIKVTARRSKLFLLNQVRHARHQRTSNSHRASMALLHCAPRGIAYRRACFLTGRRRGTIRRFGISRLRVKHLSGFLFGVRKSS